jgi:hypothetical protein
VAERPLETYDRLLKALRRVGEAAAHTDDDALREWTALAHLDALDLGEQLGLLVTTDAEQRREAVRAAVDDLDL